MTCVKVYKSNNLIYAIEIFGHSGFADAGEDIVCSAITSAVMMTHLYLDDILKIRNTTEVCDENARIYIEVPKEEAKNVQNIFNAFNMHMHNIKLDYSEYIDISEV